MGKILQKPTSENSSLSLKTVSVYICSDTFIQFPYADVMEGRVFFKKFMPNPDDEPNPILNITIFSKNAPQLIRTSLIEALSSTERGLTFLCLKTFEVKPSQNSSPFITLNKLAPKYNQTGSVRIYSKDLICYNDGKDWRKLNCNL